VNVIAESPFCRILAPEIGRGLIRTFHRCFYHGPHSKNHEELQALPNQTVVGAVRYFEKSAVPYAPITSAVLQEDKLFGVVPGEAEAAVIESA
jgi:hypothetical protein